MEVSLAAVAVMVQSAGLSVGIPSWMQWGMIIIGHSYDGDYDDDDADSEVEDADWLFVSEVCPQV